jgi:F-type H+-transporting ATPase subunit alpha
MILRQPQYKPLPVEHQVVQIYAATPQETRDSWVRKIPVEDVLRFADELIQFIESRHSQILEEIRSSGKLSDELIPKLDAALDAFAETFQPSGSLE